MPNASELQSILDSKYGTFEQQIDQVIDQYKLLYRLPELERTFAVSEEFLSRSSKMSRIVVVAIYDVLKNILVVQSQSRLDAYTLLGDRLIGAAFSPIRKDRVEEVVRWAVTSQIGADLAELRPLAVVTNHFTTNGHKVTHRGLAFMAASTIPLHGIVASGTGLKLVQAVPKEMAFQNKEILEIALKHLASKYFVPSLAEVDEPSKKRGAKFVHRHVVHRLLHPVATRPIRNFIVANISNGDSVLDVSAGNDRLIFEIYERKSPKICVVNDISWRAMEELRAKAKSTAANIIFTNHNVADIPFTSKFDVVLFKNTLHHLRSATECLGVLERLRDLGRKIVICDIEEPRRTRRGMLFNSYYEHFVGDGDQNNIFYDYPAFQRLIGNYFDDMSVKFQKIWTVRGDYMFAVLECAPPSTIRIANAA
jgi:ubiquinone/menaquinone biosynthesis C-methylase UbiE